MDEDNNFVNDICNQSNLKSQTNLYNEFNLDFLNDINLQQKEQSSSNHNSKDLDNLHKKLISLEKENYNLREKLSSISESTIEVKTVYEEQKSKVDQLTQIKLELEKQLDIAQNDFKEVTDELANRNFFIDQYKAHLELKQNVTEDKDFDNLKIKYIKQSVKLHELGLLDKNEKRKIDEIRKELKSKKLAIPDWISPLKNQDNIKKNCKIKIVEKELKRETASQCDIYKEFKLKIPKLTQNIQCNIEISQGVNDNEENKNCDKKYPSIEDIFKEFNCVPISPIPSIINSPAKEIKETNNIATCTELQNITKEINYVSNNDDHPVNEPDFILNENNYVKLDENLKTGNIITVIDNLFHKLSETQIISFNERISELRTKIIRKDKSKNFYDSDSVMWDSSMVSPFSESSANISEHFDIHEPMNILCDGAINNDDNTNYNIVNNLLETQNETDNIHTAVEEILKFHPGNTKKPTVVKSKSENLKLSVITRAKKRKFLENIVPTEKNRICKNENNLIQKSIKNSSKNNEVQTDLEQNTIMSDNKRFKNSVICKFPAKNNLRLDNEITRNIDNMEVENITEIGEISNSIHNFPKFLNKSIDNNCKISLNGLETDEVNLKFTKKLELKKDIEGNLESNNNAELKTKSEENDSAINFEINGNINDSKPTKVLNNLGDLKVKTGLQSNNMNNSDGSVDSLTGRIENESLDKNNVTKEEENTTIILEECAAKDEYNMSSDNLQKSENCSEINNTKLDNIENRKIVNITEMDTESNIITDALHNSPKRFKKSIDNCRNSVNQFVNEEVNLEIMKKIELKKGIEGNLESNNNSELKIKCKENNSVHNFEINDIINDLKPTNVLNYLGDLKIKTGLQSNNMDNCDSSVDSIAVRIENESLDQKSATKQEENTTIILEECAAKDESNMSSDNLQKSENCSEINNTKFDNIENRKIVNITEMDTESNIITDALHNSPKRFKKSIDNCRNSVNKLITKKLELKKGIESNLEYNNTSVLQEKSIEIYNIVNENSIATKVLKDLDDLKDIRSLQSNSNQSSINGSVESVTFEQNKSLVPNFQNNLPEQNKQSEQKSSVEQQNEKSEESCEIVTQNNKMKASEYRNLPNELAKPLNNINIEDILQYDKIKSYQNINSAVTVGQDKNLVQNFEKNLPEQNEKSKQKSSMLEQQNEKTEEYIEILTENNIMNILENKNVPNELVKPLNNMGIEDSLQYDKIKFHQNRNSAENSKSTINSLENRSYSVRNSIDNIKNKSIIGSKSDNVFKVPEVSRRKKLKIKNPIETVVTPKSYIKNSSLNDLILNDEEKFNKFLQETLEEYTFCPILNIFDNDTFEENHMKDKIESSIQIPKSPDTNDLHQLPKTLNITTESITDSDIVHQSLSINSNIMEIDTPASPPRFEQVSTTNPIVIPTDSTPEVLNKDNLEENEIKRIRNKYSFRELFGDEKEITLKNENTKIPKKILNCSQLNVKKESTVVKFNKSIDMENILKNKESNVQNLKTNETKEKFKNLNENNFEFKLNEIHNKSYQTKNKSIDSGQSILNNMHNFSKIKPLGFYVSVGDGEGNSETKSSTKEKYIKSNIQNNQNEFSWKAATESELHDQKVINLDNINSIKSFKDKLMVLKQKEIIHKKARENLKLEIAEKCCASEESVVDINFSPLSPIHNSEIDYHEDLFEKPIIIPEFPVNYHKNRRQTCNSLIDNLISYYSDNIYKKKQSFYSTNIFKLESVEDSKIITKLRPIFEHYLQSDGNLIQVKKCILRCLNRSQNIDLICKTIIEIIEDTNDKLIITKLTPPLPSMTLTHQKIIVIIVNLNKTLFHDEFILYKKLCDLIEKRIFKFDNEKIPLNILINLTLLYIGLIDLQKSKNPARLFICKCFYYYQKKSLPIIYHILITYPQMLPREDEQFYDNNDPIISTIKCILNSLSYNMDKKDLRHPEIFHILKLYYNYERVKPSREELIDNLIAKIRAGKLLNVSYSFSIICKHQGVEWTENYVLKKMLLPLLNEGFNLITNSDVYDNNVAAILECLSFILKPFPLNYNIEIYIKMFCNFLHATNRKIVQEAAVKAILRTSRFGLMNSFNIIAKWNPDYKIDNIIEKMILSFLNKKPPGYWRKLSKKI